MQQTPPDILKGPRTLPYEERKSQIVNAALVVFSDMGYHKAKVSDITARAGVAKGTFYLYFKSKEQLFAGLLDEFMDLIITSFFIPGADQIDSARQIRERFEQVTLSALRMLRLNRDLARIFLLEGAAWDPRFEKTVREFYKGLNAGVAKNLQLWMDKGLLRPADPNAIALCVLGMIERLAMQWTAGIPEGNFEALVKEVVKFELYGILKNPADAFSD